MEVQAHVMKCRLSPPQNTLLLVILPCYIGRLIIMRGLVILYAEYLLYELSAQFSDRVTKFIIDIELMFC